MHVMIDLETLSAANDAAIVSIGAVGFTRERGIHSDFYQVIARKSAEQYGSVNADTLAWWAKQSPEAQRVLTEGTRLLPDVLRDFAEWFNGVAEWFNGVAGRFVWGNGATFDNVILRNAYAKTGIPCPWHFRGDRCYRTAAAIFAAPRLPREGVAHNALDDARHQARVLLASRWRNEVGD